MAHTEEMLIHGVLTPVTRFDHSAQEIDDATSFVREKFIEDISNPGCYYRMVNGVKEWLNPPMLIGIEYRTTERFGSRPVYTMLVMIEAMVQGDNYVQFSDQLLNPVRAPSGFMLSTGGSRRNLPWVYMEDSNQNTFVYHTGNYVGVVVGSFFEAGTQTAYVQVWYIKQNLA